MISNFEASSLYVSLLSRKGVQFFARRQARSITKNSRHLIENTFLIVLETASEKCNERSCCRLLPPSLPAEVRDTHSFKKSLLWLLLQFRS